MSLLLDREQLISRDFPAEHPYSSHMARYALFPKFDSFEDPKRGVNARRERPINAEMPANNFDVTVIQKTKGIFFKYILVQYKLSNILHLSSLPVLCARPKIRSIAQKVIQDTTKYQFQFHIKVARGTRTMLKEVNSIYMTIIFKY